MVEYPVELVDGVRAESVAHLRPVEGDAHDPVAPGGTYVAVVGDIGQVFEAWDGAPLGGIEGAGVGFVLRSASHGLQSS